MSFEGKSVIAIIPARGGSKRIPQKNIVDFCGKPLIAWSIEAAQKAGIFDAIVVSTDDEAIAKVSREYGAEVPFLRDKKADDFSPVSEAIIRTIEQLEATGRNYDLVVQLFAVCPLRTSEEIVESLQFFTEKEAPFLISCFKFVGMNPWWAIKLDDQFKGERIFTEEIKMRSQDIPELYSPTGAIWIAETEILKKEGTFFGKDHIFWEIDWISGIDIDDNKDLKLAAALRSIR
ncbi:MAG: acylneuraminate cytidylyltransferase family protein [Mariniphaga sp.]|nr:acylneuraminate cytidylyltransferase family protein [Mariniphaga sp.]